MSDPISNITVSVLEVPFDKPIQSSLGTYVGSDYVIVELRTESGFNGFGYSTSLDRRGTKAVVSYIEIDLIPLAIGQDVTQPEALWHRMWSPNKARMRGGVGVHALSAVDTAVWDAAAKIQNQPLADVLGCARDRIDVYGSGGWLSLTDRELVAEAESHAQKGITGYKLKIGGSRDRERVSLLRRELGDDFILYTDANQNYTASEAIAASNWLADYNVAWLEEPVIADCPWDMAAVAANSNVPLAAGENVYFGWGFQDLVDRQAATYLQPDIGRCGGVTEWIKIARIAEENSLRLTSHLLHELSTCLVAAFPSGYQVEFMNFFNQSPFTQDFTLNNGCLMVPRVPGHGVEFTKTAKKLYAA